MRSKKIKVYKAQKRMSAAARVAIRNAIATHEHYKKAYFFNPAPSAGGRRKAEKNFHRKNPAFRVELPGGLWVEVHFEYSQSTRNVYYSMTVIQNDKVRDVRTLKKLL